MKRRDASTSPPSSAPPSTTPTPRWEPLPASLARWTGYALFWVTDLAGQLYAAGMARIGLQPPHVAILQILSDEGPMNQNRLAKRTRIDKAPLVGLLNALETQGLVERRPHPSDRRAFAVHLTQAGTAKLAAAEEVNAEVTARFFAPLVPAERQTLHDLLTRLATSHGPGPQGDDDA
ncbi:hypothetical protein DAETH_38140 (plasmid) [Deinococcus aetherius]|uniref:HTH marR-type domain-containing protein n=1 Tax=Deinococcus aetherius TaxID=200252 RepID=A0ABM8AJ55_9DEIO|nr:MarR family transcriptional regulator [Deinococcus aetherius]BDP43845.1 hypothetical protein DAETH_38140 [Deinococcus aetherius]